VKTDGTERLARRVVFEVINLVTQAMAGEFDPTGSAVDGARAHLHTQATFDESKLALPPEVAEHVHAVTFPAIHEVLHGLQERLESPKERKIVQVAYRLLEREHSIKQAPHKQDPFTAPGHTHPKPKAVVPLSKAAHKLAGKIEFRGLPISLEHKAGDVRRWYDAHEKREGFTTQVFPYGYIRGTEGLDDEHIDVYIGPDETARYVYVIDQMKGPTFEKLDEQKVMLGFPTAKAAKAAYMVHFDKPGFFGGLVRIPFAAFAAHVQEAKNHGKAVPATIAKGDVPYTTGTAFNLTGQSQGGACYPRAQAIPDMRTWEAPKTAERVKREREATENRRRAFSQWARAFMGMYGSPPKRVLRYGHQFVEPYQARGASLAQRRPQIVTDPLPELRADKR